MHDINNDLAAGNQAPCKKEKASGISNDEALLMGRCVHVNVPLLFEQQSSMRKEIYDSPLNVDTTQYHEIAICFTDKSLTNAGLACVL